MARARRGEKGALALLAVLVGLTLTAAASLATPSARLEAALAANASSSSSSSSSALAASAAALLRKERSAITTIPPPGSYAWRRPAILALGDSITEYALLEGGWWRGFQGAYARKADAVNRGLSGYNSRWALLAVDEAAASFGGRLIAAVVWYGANDCRDPQWTGGGTDMSVPPDEYGRNLRAIAKKLREAYAASASASAAARRSGWAAAGVGESGAAAEKKKRRSLFQAAATTEATTATAGEWPLPPVVDDGQEEQGVKSHPVVVFVTPAPLHEAQWLEHVKASAAAAGKPLVAEVSDRRNSRLELYAQEARRAAEDVPGAVVADVHAAMVEAGAAKGDDEARAFFSDGLHLSAKGNEVALGAIRAALERTAASPSRLPYHLPTYGQVDTSDPSRTFGDLQEKGWGP